MSTREESNEDWELGLNLSDQKEVRTQGYEGTWVFFAFFWSSTQFCFSVRSQEGALHRTSDRTRAKCFLSPTHGLKVPAGNLISSYIIYNTVLYYNIYCIWWEKGRFEGPRFCLKSIQCYSPVTAGFIPRSESERAHKLRYCRGLQRTSQRCSPVSFFGASRHHGSCNTKSWSVLTWIIYIYIIYVIYTMTVGHFVWTPPNIFGNSLWPQLRYG